VSLFFDDISKFPPIKVTFAVHLFLLLDFSLDLISLPQSHLYLRHSLQRPADFTMSLGHGIYAQFMAQSALANGGRRVGLLHGASTGMALWFYAR
jgi:hypothetical protein